MSKSSLFFGGGGILLEETKVRVENRDIGMMNLCLFGFLPHDQVRDSSAIVSHVIMLNKPRWLQKRLLKLKIMPLFLLHFVIW